MGSGKLEASRGPARLAGSLFLFFTAVSIIHFTVFEQPLLPAHKASDILAYLAARPLHARLGILADLVVFTAGIALGVALHAALKGAGKGLALFALAMTLAQFTIATAIELSSFAALALAADGPALAGLGEGQRGALADLVLGLRADGYVMVQLLFCLALGIFAFLMLRARALPKWLAVFGVGASALSLACTAAQVASPAAFKAAAQGSAVPVMLFMVLAGFSLLNRAGKKGRP